MVFFNSKYTNRYIFITLATLLLSFRANAQSSELDRYISIALENNKGLIEQQLNVKIADKNSEIARSYFLPNISLQASYDIAEGGRTIDVPVGDLLNPLYGSVNDLLGENRFPTNLENVSTPILLDDFQETKLRVIQPLFNTDIFYSYKAQRSLQDVQDIKKEAFKNELIKEVKIGYYNYLSAVKAVEIHQSTKNQLEEVLEYNKSLFKNGEITKDVLSQTELELSNTESEILSFKNKKSKAKYYFNILLNRPLGTDIIQSEETLSMFIAEGEDYSVNSALRNRSDLQALRKGSQALEYTLQREKYGRLPEIFVSADVGYQGVGYNFSDQEFMLIRFGLKWELFNALKHTKEIQKARLKLQKNENKIQTLQDQIELQVMNSKEAVSHARAMLGTRKLGEKSAYERFNIVKNRYEQGEVIFLEYLEAQKDLQRSKLKKLIAQYDLLKEIARLDSIVENIK